MEWGVYIVLACGIGALGFNAWIMHDRIKGLRGILDEDRASMRRHIKSEITMLGDSFRTKLELLESTTDDRIGAIKRSTTTQHRAVIRRLDIDQDRKWYLERIPGYPGHWASSNGNIYAGDELIEEMGPAGTVLPKHQARCDRLNEIYNLPSLDAWRKKAGIE